jgi:hypothetical protein
MAVREVAGKGRTSYQQASFEGWIQMRKLTAIIAALGLLASTSLTPVYAGATSTDTGVKSDDLSAAKKKAKKAKKKKSELAVTDLSAAKKKAKKAKKAKKKKSELAVTDLSAAAKKKAKKAKKKASNEILYRIAA